MSPSQTAPADAHQPSLAAGHSSFLPASSGEWMDILDSAGHDTFHLPGYLAMEAESLGGSAVAFVHREEGKSMLLPLVLRPITGSAMVDAVSPYGYSGPVSNVGSEDHEFWRRACSGLLDALRDISAVTCFVRLNSLLDFPRVVLSEHGLVMQHGNTVAIDLHLTPAEMWAKTRKNHRRDITRARREGLQVVIDPDWARIGTFLDIYYETMERVGAEEYYFFDRSYFDRLREAVGARVQLFLVEHDGQVDAAGLVLEEDGIVQFHLGGTRNAALALQPAKLMYDEVRLWAKDRGNRVLHLGAGAGGEGNPLFHFKAGFSDWQPPLYTWRIVPDATAYAELVRASSPTADPTDLGSFFPAYRQPPS